MATTTKKNPLHNGNGTTTIASPFQSNNQNQQAPIGTSNTGFGAAMSDALKRQNDQANQPPITTAAADANNPIQNGNQQGNNNPVPVNAQNNNNQDANPGNTNNGGGQQGNNNQQAPVVQNNQNNGGNQNQAAPAAQNNGQNNQNPAPAQNNQNQAAPAAQNNQNGQGGNALNLVAIGQQFDQVSQQISGVLGDLQPGSDFNQIFTGDKNAVEQNLTMVQQNINDLLTNNPAQTQGTVGDHLRTAANQINLEENFINQGGANSALGVRDIHRDILDIVNNDPTLAAAAKQGGQQGFTPLAPLMNKPQPFQTDGAQTSFLNQTNQDIQNLTQQATNVVNGNGDKAGLINQLNSFAKNVDQFATSQGGVYSARFNNELALNGTNGTVVNQLVNGLQNNDKAAVQAANMALVANIGDVGTNQVPVGGGMFAFAAANAGA